MGFIFKTPAEKKEIWERKAKKLRDELRKLVRKAKILIGENKMLRRKVVRAQKARKKWLATKYQDELVRNRSEIAEAKTKLHALKKDLKACVENLEELRRKHAEVFPPEERKVLFPVRYGLASDEELDLTRSYGERGN